MMCINIKSVCLTTLPRQHKNFGREQKLSAPLPCFGANFPTMKTWVAGVGWQEKKVTDQAQFTQAGMQGYERLTKLGSCRNCPFVLQIGRAVDAWRGISLAS